MPSLSSKSSTSSNRRKGAAIGLAVLGIAGLSLASASQLNLTDSATFQSGSATLNADCQGATTIPVKFGTPTISTTTGAYSVTGITFSGVAAACGNLSYKAAVLVGTTWTELAIGSVPATGGDLTATLPTAVTDANAITKVALSIYS